MNYSDKLKDERWQTRRKEILALDRNKCRKCLTTEGLQVHHLGYLVGAEPWQYPNEYLITLCENCHSSEELYKKTVKQRCEALGASGISWEDINNCLIMAFEDVEIESE